MHKLAIALALGLSCALPVHAQSPAELLVSINSGVTQTQGVAMVLASQALAQKGALRGLLVRVGGEVGGEEEVPPGHWPKGPPCACSRAAGATSWR